MVISRFVFPWGTKFSTLGLFHGHQYFQMVCFGLGLLGCIMYFYNHASIRKFPENVSPAHVETVQFGIAQI